MVNPGPGTAAAPRTLRIPITNIFDGNDYSAQILIGSQKIAANVILDTGSSTLAVVPSVYQVAKDADMKPTSLAQQVQYGTGAWIGPVVKTSLVLGDPSGATVTLTNAPIAVTVTQSKDDFTGVDGIMGLAYFGLNGVYDLAAYLTTKHINPPVTFPWPFSTSNFAKSWAQFQALINRLSLKSTPIDPYFAELETMGLTLNKFAFYTLRSWVRLATTNQTAIASDPWNNGYFILGGGEEQHDLYTGDFIDVDVVDDLYYNTNLISTQVTGGPVIPAAALQPEYAGAGSNCIIDSGTSELLLANDVFSAILKSLEQLNPKFLSTIQQADKNGISSSLLNLAEWPDIHFILTGADGSPVTLTCSPPTYWQEDYPAAGQAVFQISSYGPAPAGSPEPANQSILGLPLMNNYYTVFDRSQGTSNGIIRFAPITLPK